MKYILLFAIFFYVQTGFSQLSTIKGVIQDQTEQPLAGVTVEVKNQRISSITNNQGKFELNADFKYPITLVIRYLGFNTKEIVLNESNNNLAVQLTESALTLQQVEVIGSIGQGYKPDYTFSATKTGAALIDIPQSVSVITKELIQDQQGFRTGDVVKNVSGVNQFSAYDDITLRGFRSNTQLINGLRTVTGFWSQPNLVNIERVEIIKGPAAAMFGNTDPGGTINRVTKRPLAFDKKSISFSTGSFNTNRATIDLTGPVNESKTLLYRLNVGYESSETFKTLQGFQDITVAPSITFIPNEKTRLNFDLAYSLTDGKLYRGQAIFGATAGTNLNSTPIGFAIAKPNDFLKEKNFYSTISLNHQFNKNLSFNASYLKYQFKENLQEHRTSNNFAVDGNGNQLPTLMQLQTIRRLSNVYNDNITTYFVQKANTGEISHQILLGYDYNRISVPLGGSSQTARGYRLLNGGISNTYNPARKAEFQLDAQGNPVPNVPHFNLVNPDYSIANTNAYTVTSTSSPEALGAYHGIYIQDQLKWKKLSVLLGLRKEFIADYVNYNKTTENKVKQDAWIPRIGLVYSLLPHINFYTTYVEGFVPQASSSLANPNSGGPFDPLTSNMIEGGFKAEFFNKRLLATTGIYQIEQNNILVNANVAGSPELLQQRGQERGRGIELDLSGQLLSNLNISANYSFSKTIITEDSNTENIGKIKENAPQHQGGLWARYNVEKGDFAGLGFGVGSNFVSGRRTFSTILTLPSYQVYDAAIYYKVNNFQISANFFNVFNKTYWIGGYDFNRLFPGNPRNFLVGISYTLN